MDGIDRPSEPQPAKAERQPDVPAAGDVYDPLEHVRPPEPRVAKPEHSVESDAHALLRTLSDRVHESRTARFGDHEAEPACLRDLIPWLRRDDAPNAPTAVDTVGPTWLDSPHRPPPVDTTRTYHQQGHLDPPLPREQEALDRSVARDDNGDPLRFPDPRDAWSAEVNGDGKNANPFRGNNCLDCSLSAISTWYGEPKVSAPRHQEYHSDGSPAALAGEAGGPRRAERWLGHTYERIAPDASGYAEIEKRLLDAGHGAAAAIINAWPRGGAHAWNAFNHEGTVYWVDTQGKKVADTPLYPDPGPLKAILMDREGNKA